MQDANERSGDRDSDDSRVDNSDAPRFNVNDEEALDLARYRECKRDIYDLMNGPAD